MPVARLTTPRKYRMFLTTSGTGKCIYAEVLYNAGCVRAESIVKTHLGNRLPDGPFLVTFPLTRALEPSNIA